jgi:hypothetical protein
MSRGHVLVVQLRKGGKASIIQEEPMRRCVDAGSQGPNLGLADMMVALDAISEFPDLLLVVPCRKCADSTEAQRNWSASTGLDDPRH